MLRRILPSVGALLVVVFGILPGAPAMAEVAVDQGRVQDGLVVQPFDNGVTPVSYTHLTLPTKRIV